jgi:PAS domain S-box-containing protein
MKSEKTVTLESNNINNILATIRLVSDRLLDVTDEKEVYNIIADGIKSILPGSYFLVSKLQPDDMNFRIIESYGFEKYFDIILLVVGKDPFTIDFPFKDLTELQFQAFESRKVYHFPGGIYDLSNGVLNKFICKSIEKLLSITDVCAISFYLDKKYYGGITFFLPDSLIKSGIMNKDAELAIEIIANAASAVIQKLRDSTDRQKYQQELFISQSRFNQLIGQLTDVIWKANIDGSEISDLANSFEKHYGRPSSAFRENPNLWIDSTHPDDREIVTASGTKLFQTGNSVSEYRVIKPDGTIVWFHDRKSIVYDADGKPVGMGGIATDITERKLIEEDLKVKNYALNASPTAIGLADLNGVITYINDAYVDLWGYSNKNEIVGKNITEFTRSKALVSDVMKSIFEGKSFKGEGSSVNKNGKSFNFIISAKVVKSKGRPICLIALFNDITELKQIEAKLNENQQSLIESNNTKDKFFSIIAHDLKSPFNGILGFSDILETEYNDLDDETRLEYIKIINTSSKNTFKLLENLLEWSRLQQNGIVIRKEELNIKDLVNECIAPYSLNAFNKNITIITNIPDDVFINVDCNSMKTVFRNLLNNALKYTPDNGKIIIDLKVLNDEIEIDFTDNGVGIGPNRLSKIFSIGETKSTLGTANEKGTGLGLILCKELISKNSGKISVESEIGVGSVFKIVIPA